MLTKERLAIEASDIPLTEVAGVGELKISFDSSSIKLVWSEDWGTSASSETLVLDRKTGIVSANNYFEDNFQSGSQPGSEEGIRSTLEGILTRIGNRKDEAVDVVKAFQRCLGLKLGSLHREERIRVIDQEVAKLRRTANAQYRGLTTKPQYEAVIVELIESVKEAELYGSNPYRVRRGERNGVVLELFTNEDGYFKGIVFDGQHGDIIKTGVDRGLPVVHEIGYESAPVDWLTNFDRLMRVLEVPFLQP